MKAEEEKEMDAYSKFIFSVIAIALSVIALQQAGIVPALAQTRGAQRVIVCDGSDGVNPSAGDGSCASVVNGWLRTH
jgi:hypothetical protein